MDRYKNFGRIGEGSFGKVYKATDKTTDSIVALKVIKTRHRSSKEIKGLRSEFIIQRQLSHPNIIQMIDSFETENEIVVVTEHAYEDLHKYLGKKGSLDEKKTQHLTFDLVSALYYLHSHRILHRDLKPQNILLDKNQRAKLCDFGFARNMTMGTHVLTSVKGTPLYMSPEVLSSQPYDHLADIWSLGCIIYEVLVGETPFSTVSILQLLRLVESEPVKWPSNLSDNCITFLRGILEKQTSMRFTWPQILAHPFVEGNIIILKENIPDSPFTSPLTAAQLREKKKQTDTILNKNQINYPKVATAAMLPGLSHISLRDLTDENLSSSRDSMKAILQSDVELNETDLDEETSSSSTNIPQSKGAIKKVKQVDLTYVSGNSNLIVNNMNDNFPCQDFGIHSKLPETRTSSSSIKVKSKASCLEKRKLSQNLDNFQIRLGQDVDVNRKPRTLSCGTIDITKSVAQLTINKSSNQGKEDKKAISPPPMPTGWDSCDGSQSQPIENEEWIAFLQKSMHEILEGELESLKQTNLVSIIVAPLRNAKASCKVLENVAILLSLPMVMGGTQSDLAMIESVYVEVKLVPNLIYASKLLCAHKQEFDTPSPVQTPPIITFRSAINLSSDEIKTLSNLYELVNHLVHINDNFLTQFCDAIAWIQGTDEIFISLISSVTEDRIMVRLVNSILALLCCVLREFPENADLVENIIFNQSVNLISLMKHSNGLLRSRMCMLLRLLGRFSCFSLQSFWSIEMRDTLEGLLSDSNDFVRMEAENALEELRQLSFYGKIIES